MLTDPDPRLNNSTKSSFAAAPLPRNSLITTSARLTGTNANQADTTATSAMKTLSRWLGRAITGRRVRQPRHHLGVLVVLTHSVPSSRSGVASRDTPEPTLRRTLSAMQGTLIRCPRATPAHAGASRLK